MGRKRLFSQSFAAGQFFLLANIVYSLAMVPLALAHLSMEQFGLWALAMQIANFLLLLDAGFSSATGRLLIDVKDQRPSLEYGRLCVATLLILVAVTVAVILAGVCLASGLVKWMKISSGLSNVAVTLFTGQVMIAAASIPARLVGGCLTAYARIDLLNLAFAISMLISLVAMWAALNCGVGLFSLLWANGVGVVLTSLISFAGARKCGCLPLSRELAFPGLEDFKKVVTLGHNIFLNQIGNMVLSLSQSVLLGRFSGLETVGIWSVGSKAYSLILQSADKLTQSAGPIFSEMWTRREFLLFGLRMRQIKLGGAVLASLGAAVVIGLNSEFVAAWTSGKVAWDSSYNVGLAALFAVRTLNSVDSLPILASKLYGTYRFVPLIEAVCFVLAASMLIPRGGVMGLLAAALASALLVTTPYLLYRERKREIAMPCSRVNGAALFFSAVLPPLAAWAASSVTSSWLSVWPRLGFVVVVLILSSAPVVLIFVSSVRETLLRWHKP